MPQNIVGSSYRNVDLGVTGQVAKNAPAALTGYHLINVGSGARFVKFYNKATAPTHADTPVITVGLVAGGESTLHGVSVPFSAGISVRATTGLADNDTGAPTSGDVTVNVFYTS